MLLRFWRVGTAFRAAPLCTTNCLCVACLIQCATWPVQMCDMTHAHVRHDSFTCETWLISGESVQRFEQLYCVPPTVYVWRDSFIRIHMCDITFMCDMTHACVRHDAFVCANASFKCEMWLISRSSLVCHQLYMRDMTHSYVQHDWFICATWLINMCCITHSYVRHDSFMCAPWLIPNSSIAYHQLSDMTQAYSFILGKHNSTSHSLQLPI